MKSQIKRQHEEARDVLRKKGYYNLDMIIFIGFSVNSKFV